MITTIGCLSKLYASEVRLAKNIANGYKFCDAGVDNDVEVRSI